MELVKRSVKMNLKNLKDCHEISAGSALPATTISARMAAAAGPLGPQQCRCTTACLTTLQRDLRACDNRNIE